MLQRVRDTNRMDRAEPSIWPDEPSAYEDDRWDSDVSRSAKRRMRRQRLVRRITTGVTFVVTLTIISAAVYLAGRSGMIDTLLAELQAAGRSTSSDGLIGPAAAQATPATAEAAPTTVPQAAPSAIRAAPSATQTAQQPQPAAPQQPPTQAQVAARAMPDVQGLAMLVRTSIVALHQANVTGNYAVLREIAAPGFQQANSPAALSAAFADLRGRNIDLAQVTVVNPTLETRPVLNQQGLLRLAGFFPAGAERVNFDLVFQLVGGNWKLFGIGAFPPKDSAPPAGKKTASAGKAKAAARSMPDDATLVTLIRGAVIGLNQANITGDYSVLRDISAPGFRSANSLDRLAEIFSDLRGRHLDLSPVAVIDPRLFRAAAIDAKGFLRLTGYFPSRPEQVNFDLAFEYGEGQWQLFGIGVNTSREEPVAAKEGAPAAAPAVVQKAAAQNGAKAVPAAPAEPPAPRPRPHS